ncbi:hypothetical protein MIND_00927700 [Mycena indigotica]|uniref:Uncharacterized protein n=1 Tax=Mycena indigotica TaxID=2126181 RepID=A0A8H6VWZ8_9AGAR|nr:uncharacterized protein MIND_00927700 [Mycena indigotica]KAF7296957.1 hypothetical protein MIND_00927700 [Mycena indigotica]
MPLWASIGAYRQISPRSVRRLPRDWVICSLAAPLLSWTPFPSSVTARPSPRQVHSSSPWNIDWWPAGTGLPSSSSQMASFRCSLAALFAVLMSGIIPLSTHLADLWHAHGELTNIAITAAAALVTAHLKYTLSSAGTHQTAAMLQRGFTLNSWAGMQTFARREVDVPVITGGAGIRAAVLAGLQVPVFWSIAQHSTLLVAILQPEPFTVAKPLAAIDDVIPCGVQRSQLSFNLSGIPADVQNKLYAASAAAGMQLDGFYDQVAANTTTVGVGHVFVKDNDGYGTLGGLVNGLQEVPGVWFTTRCGAEAVASSLWENAGLELPRFTRQTLNTSLTSNVTQQIVSSVPLNIPFGLPDANVALFGVVRATGSGALMTVNGTGNITGCTWTSNPGLIKLRITNGTAAAYDVDLPDGTIYPSAIGLAVAATIEGMAQAAALGTTLFPRSLGVGPTLLAPAPNVPQMLATLLGDGAKVGLTGYINYVQAQARRGSPPTGVATCRANSRATTVRWRFRNLSAVCLGAVALNLGCGALAMWTVLVGVWTRRARVRDVDALQVVDAFRMGLAAEHGVRSASGSAMSGRRNWVREVRQRQVIMLRNGQVVVKY